MIVIGIDPGGSGAVAAVSSAKGLIEIWDMPVAKVSVSRPNQLRVSGAVLQEIFFCINDMSQEQNPVVYMEEVGAMPGQGVVSTFNFGINAGIVIGVISALGFPLIFTRPPAWKKAVGIPAKADKSASRELAMRLWPDKATPLLKRVKDHNRADAALIAWSGVKALRGF